ncbi:DUF1206 domain-containing protein [Rhodococcus rhodnii]|uniref:DUF1206 domain-containing protein n=1 Tax=Rhodococcus rhodnii TaxID=38312 RepID=A0A6P2C9G6_9NOCA|nr:DUF1206 domain-containing protein [Rhodococcus rhodnii]TXG89397.1 DUF1206 domain-containing protein [Rhodococcus rhodnii]
MSDVGTKARKARQSTAFEKAARAGHVVSGGAHLLIGYLVLLMAFGAGGASADQSGALARVASQPGGEIALWIGAIAFAALALWRIVEGISADPGDSVSDQLDERGKPLATAVVYVALAWSALSFAMGSGQSSGEQNAGISARLMESTAGTIVLAIAGLVIAGVGVYHVHKGATKGFADDLKKNPGKPAEILGVTGYVAKGLVLAGTGILVVTAAATSDPSKATGIDGAVTTLGSWPFGQVLLVLAGLGLGAYGAYCFVLARHARM